MIDEELRIVLTTIGRVLYYLGKTGKDLERVSKLRTIAGSGIYQVLVSGVKKGVWEYDMTKDVIKLTEKGKKLAERLSCL